MRALDLFDRRILAIVQQDASLPSEKLADQVGLSPSAVQRRLRRLRADGVISAFVALVDPAKVGRPAFFIVGLEVECERPDLIEKLRNWLAVEDGVQQVYYVTGVWDFLLVVAARHLEAYEGLMARLLADNPNVRRFTTHVALGIAKRRLNIPIG